jgi:dTDP-4-amino-4,6-dideoxygalactose transaminase
MGRIGGICRKHGLKLIEDCAQALGARYGARRVGSFGDAAAFSFCTDKIISTGGEGGMLVVRDEAVRDRAWSYKDHGKARAKHLDKTTSNGCFRWLHDDFGSNYRMTEMQSAIGLLQLNKLPRWLAARRANAAALDAALDGIPALRVTRPPQQVEHASYKYYFFLRNVPPSDEGAARDALVLRLQNMGVPCGPGSCPEIYRESAFVDTAWRPSGRLPVARTIGATSMMLPVDPTLSIDDMHRMGERIARGVGGHVG